MTTNRITIQHPPFPPNFSHDLSHPHPTPPPGRPMDNAPMETAVSSDSISASNPDFLSFPRYPTIRPLDQIVCDSRNGGAGFPPPVQQAEEEEEDEDGDEGSVDYWGADDEEIERQLREQERQQQLQEVPDTLHVVH